MSRSTTRAKNGRFQTTKATLSGALFSVALFTPMAALAGEADVVDVAVAQTGAGVYRFDVTVRHADEGWDHYADAWEVLGPDGEVLGTRVLMHPHDSEQPFTRSLSGVAIPDGAGSVTVRAHDSAHGYGGAEMSVALPQ